MKKIFRYSLVGAAIAPLVTMVSCNVSLKREIKDNKLADQTLFLDSQAKDLGKMIQAEFAGNFLQETWTNDVQRQTIADWDQQKKQFQSTKIPAVAQAIGASELSRKYTTSGKTAGHTLLRRIEHRIWRNTAIDPKIRALLNEIKTVYNRRKNVYPIDEQIVVGANGQKYGQVKYQVDLLSPMKRRFMGKYFDLVGNVPLNLPANDENFWKIYQNFDKPLENPQSLPLILNQYFKHPHSIKYGFSLNNWFKGADKLNDKMIDMTSLRFAKKAGSQNEYEIKYDNLSNFDIDVTRQDPNLNTSPIEEVALKYDTTKSTFSNQTYFGTSKLADVASYLEQRLFTQNDNEYIKNLFSGENKLVAKIEFVSLAGTSINGFTVKDYVDNIAIVNDTTKNSAIDLGYINIFVTSSVDKTIAWYASNIPFSYENNGGTP